MRDEQAHFFIAIADLCAAANLAGLSVEIVTASNQRVSGVPSAPPPSLRPSEELDDTGYARAVLVDDSVVDLAEITCLCITAPDAPARRR